MSEDNSNKEKNAQQETDDDMSDMLNMLDDDSSDLGAIAAPPAEVKRTIPVPSTKSRLEEIDGDDPASFMESAGVKSDRAVPDIKLPWMSEHVFTLVRTIEQVRQIVDECLKRGRCSLDLETQGLDNRITYVDGKPETVHKVVGFCICYDGYEGFYIPVRHHLQEGEDLNVQPIAEVEAEISRLCHAAIPVPLDPSELAEDPLSFKKFHPIKVVIGFWNAQFDQEFLYPITGIDWWHPESFEDGILAGFSILSSDKELGLKGKSKQLLKDSRGNPYEMIKLKELFFGKTKDIHFDRLAPDEPGVVRYAGSDAICTYKLIERPELVPLALKKYPFTYRLEKQVSEVLRTMERNRVRILRERVRKVLAVQEKQRDELLERIRVFAWENKKVRDLDPNSPKQLSEFLFEKGDKGLDVTPKPEKTASGQYKTDADTLEELAATPNAPTILKDIVTYREVDKYIGTYLLSLANNPDSNDEIRVSFKQTGAASGRFSAPAGKPEQGYSGVPIHGIPSGGEKSEIRRTFVAREGYTMIKADFAAEELRIAANVSGEPVWIDEFLHGTGDLHSITARAFFGKEKVTKDERNVGKLANFTLLYGGGPKAIIRATGCDEIEARRRKQAFDKAVPTFSSWSKEQHKQVKKNLGVYTAFGRWLAIPDATHEDGAIRSSCERHATNYQIQGAGADIMKIALVLLHKRFYKLGWLKNGDDSVRMLLTVHDEVVFEVRHDRVAEALPMIVEIMEFPGNLPKPKWRVPLIVEPLVGFNWASGYKVERHNPDHPLEAHQVLINGFVYSLTREPKKNKKTGVITEELDTQEVVDVVIDDKGKPNEVFRVVDAPWIVHAPGIISAPTPAPFTAPVVTNDETTVQVPDVQVPAAVAQAPAPPVAAPMENLPVIQKPQPKPGERLLHLRLLHLNDRSVSHVLQCVLNNIDNDDGWDLYLTDSVGEPLLAAGRFKVVKEDLIEALLEKHLISDTEIA